MGRDGKAGTIVYLESGDPDVAGFSGERDAAMYEVFSAGVIFQNPLRSCVSPSSH